MRQEVETEMPIFTAFAERASGHTLLWKVFTRGECHVRAPRSGHGDLVVECWGPETRHHIAQPAPGERSLLCSRNRRLPVQAQPWVCTLSAIVFSRPTRVVDASTEQELERGHAAIIFPESPSAPFHRLLSLYFLISSPQLCK